MPAQHDRAPGRPRTTRPPSTASTSPAPRPPTGSPRASCPATCSTSSRCPSTTATCGSPPPRAPRGPARRARSAGSPCWRPRASPSSRSAPSTDLGRTEQIYAVRFLGDTGYVVTFRQTDPLYVIDLSDPANPTLQGELKIPGYSAYLHPIDETHLLGIGQEADDNGHHPGPPGVAVRRERPDEPDPGRPGRLPEPVLRGRVRPPRLPLLGRHRPGRAPAGPATTRSSSTSAPTPSTSRVGSPLPGAAGPPQPRRRRPAPHHRRQHPGHQRPPPSTAQRWPRPDQDAHPLTPAHPPTAAPGSRCGSVIRQGRAVAPQPGGTAADAFRGEDFARLRRSAGGGGALPGPRRLRAPSRCRAPRPARRCGHLVDGVEEGPGRRLDHVGRDAAARRP